MATFNAAAAGGANGSLFFVNQFTIETVTGNSTQLTVTTFDLGGGTIVLTVHGTGFTLSGNNITGGVISSIDMSVGGVNQGSFNLTAIASELQSEDGLREAFIGADVINGGPGNDTLFGGYGSNNDTFNGNGGTDAYVFAAIDGLDTPDIGATVNGGSGVDTLRAHRPCDFRGATLSSIDRIRTDSTATISTLQLGNGIASNLKLLLEDEFSELKIFKDQAGAFNLSSFTFENGGIGKVTIQGYITSETINGAVTRDTIIGDDGVDHLSGLGGNDTLDGGNGSDTLDGGAGTDTLKGGLDNDTYVLANGADAVQDDGGAADLATSTISRSLLVGGLTAIENLTLLSGNINGTGNALANLIVGSTGNNILDGGAATDTLRGLTGNDTYVLANGVDIVQDTGGTADLVTSTITRSLLAAGLTVIEKLTLVSGNINGTGNNLANLITGSTGNNVLDGGAATDTLRGLTGNDTYVLGNGADIVQDTGGTADLATSTITRSLLAGGLTAIENLTLLAGNINGTGNNLNNLIVGSAGVNTLTGGVGADRLSGLAANDVLIGGVGIDILTGGANNDFFVFNAPLNAANRDIVTDFSAALDTFRLENGVMPGLGAAGALNPNLFFAGAAAHDASDRIVYNKTTGALFYDSNGNAAGGVTQLATLTTLKPVLTAADFVVI